MKLTHADYARLGGFESAEVVMWMVMRGAMAARIECKHRDYYLPSMTGIAVAVYENHAADDRAMQEARAERASANASATSYAASSGWKAPTRSRWKPACAPTASTATCTSVVLPAFRERFRADPAATFDEADLTAEERDLITRRDWRGMIHYGVIFFLLEKLDAVSGVSNLHIYAAMRGQSLEDFPEDPQRARRALLGERRGRPGRRLGRAGCRRPDAQVDRHQPARRVAYDAARARHPLHGFHCTCAPRRAAVACCRPKEMRRDLSMAYLKGVSRSARSR